MIIAVIICGKCSENKGEIMTDIEIISIALFIATISPIIVIITFYEAVRCWVSLFRKKFQHFRFSAFVGVHLICRSSTENF